MLDSGCGARAITRGTAEKVATRGFAVGMDSNAGLIQHGRHRHRNVPNLRFAMADIHDLPCTGAFDIVTAAPVLQWLAERRRALLARCRATRPCGRNLVLEYNHEKLGWAPTPPVSM